MDFEDLDYYELLGLPRNASADEIKRAYRREITKYHPDRFANAAPEQQEYAVLRSQRINEAYHVLGNSATRSRYALKRGARGGAPTPAPPPPRDHLHELYEQARFHLEAGRPLEAVAALRQLQQLNPLYRDSADLMALAKAQIAQRSGQRMPPMERLEDAARIPRRILIIGGTTGVLAAVALVAWAFGRLPSPITVHSSVTSVAAVPSEPPLPTFVPTAEPTPTPTRIPTPTVLPTATVTPDSRPTATRLPTPEALQPLGQLLVEETFDRRAWAQQDTVDWSVGYRDGRYRIAADVGIGLIWSYRTGPSGDVSYTVDTQLAGEGGLLLRFANESNYLRCTITSDGAFAVGQAQNGSLTLLAEGRSQAINTGEQPVNRIEARLRGNTLTFLANGQTLADVRVSNPPDSPRYGLVVVAENTAGEAFFDNLEIRTVDS